MSLLRRVMGGLEQRQAGTLSEPPDWLWDALAGAQTYTGRAVSVDSALGLIPVWSAVRLIAGTVGSLPLLVYRGDGRDRQRARDAKQWDLLHDGPNGEDSADQAWENITGHMLLWGNAYLEKVKDGAGRVVELWPVAPSRVRVERARDGTMRKLFRIDNEARLLDESTILHIPGFGYNGLVGLSPITICRQGLATALAREEFEGRFYANNAHPGGVLQVPKTLSDDAARRLKSEWEGLHRGLSNSSRVAVLEEGATWQSIGMPLEDMQFIEHQRFSVNQIARLFNISPEMIGGDRQSSMTYSTVEYQSIHFATYTLRRWLVRIEKGLLRDRDLFPDRSLYPEFLIEALLRGDSKARGDFYRTMREIGAYSPNDIREKENEPPRPGGDVYQDTPSGAAPPAGDTATGGDAAAGAGSVNDAGT